MRNHSFGERKLSMLDRLIFSMRARRIKEYFANRQAYADFGCGFSGDLLVWAKHNTGIKRFVGVDISVNRQAFEANGIAFLENDLNAALPLDSDSQDIVSSLAVIEHLDRPQVLVSEAWRVLNKGGIFILTTPTKQAKPVLELMASLRLIDRAEIDDHKHYFNSDELRDLLLAGGFPIDGIKCKTFMFGMNNFVFCHK